MIMQEHTPCPTDGLPETLKVSHDNSVLALARLLLRASLEASQGQVIKPGASLVGAGSTTQPSCLAAKIQIAEDESGGGIPEENRPT